MSQETAALAALYLAEHRRYDVFRDDEAAHRRLLLIASMEIEASRDGVQSWCRIGGRCLGYIGRSWRRFAQFGASGEMLVVHLEPGVPEALDWARAQLAPLRWTADQVALGLVSSAHSALLPQLAEQGLGVDTVELLGSTERALEGVPESPQFGGLRHAPLTSDHVPAALALREAIFADPQDRRYCWFAANPGHIRRQRAGFTEEIASGSHAFYGLFDGERLVGVFGSSLVLANPLWGPRGGLELYFAPEIRGRGHARAAYRVTLEALRDAGCAVFKGASCQAPVLALAVRMGRVAQAVNLRAGSAFPLAHFASVLPELEGGCAS